MGDKVAAYQWGLRLFVAPLEWLQSGRGALFPWAAVLIGVGVGVWFAQGNEPAAGSYSLAALLVVAGLVTGWRGPDLSRPLALGLAALAAGWLAAGIRAHSVTAPVLSFRYYGPVEGRIVHIDRSQSDKLRLTLDRVILREVSPDRTPLRVRVSLQTRPEWLEPLKMSRAHNPYGDGNAVTRIISLLLSQNFSS